MRSLLILCEPRHESAIRALLAKFAHPRLIGKLVDVMAVDLNHHMGEGQVKVIAWVHSPRDQATNGCLVVATKEVSSYLSLPILVSATSAKLQVTSVADLTRQPGKGDPLVKSLVNQCALDVISASTAAAQQWSHSTITRPAVDHWIGQFARLGSYGWLGKALLGQMNLTSHAGLSETLHGMSFDPSAALSVNREPRGNFKSADVLGTMLNKRFAGRPVHGSPAIAIEQHGARNVVLIEDGLWSGTEAMGIIDSLLGKRDDRLKTARLQDPTLLSKTQFRLAYAIGTDYGVGLVKRHLAESGLEHIQVECAEVLQVATPELLENLATPGYNIDSILAVGPDAAMLQPHVFQALRAAGFDAGEVARAKRFSTEVGKQLFNNYLLVKQQAGWQPWPEQKIQNAANGMHGLGLTYGFAHSIPKACLPLMWGSGKVAFNGKEVDWVPLFPNS